MDAVKFLKERKRLCQMYEVCGSCPACRASGGCIFFSVTNGATPEEQSEFMEAWSTAHPRKTRQSVFLEQYPNARIDSQAVIYVCPADAYGDKVCPKNEENVHMPCRDCRKEFWMQEVE